MLVPAAAPPPEQCSKEPPAAAPRSSGCTTSSLAATFQNSMVESSGQSSAALPVSSTIEFVRDHSPLEEITPSRETPSTRPADAGGPRSRTRSAAASSDFIAAISSFAARIAFSNPSLATFSAAFLHLFFHDSGSSSAKPQMGTTASDNASAINPPPLTLLPRCRRIAAAALVVAAAFEEFE